MATSETGAKSARGSYLSFACVSGANTVTASGASMIVLPSGAAFFSASAAMKPVAPGRFSTTTGAPSEVFSRSTMSRAIRSDVPARRETDQDPDRAVLRAHGSGTSEAQTGGKHS